MELSHLVDEEGGIRNRKSAFWDHHGKDSIKQKSSMDAKSGENF